jgi:signal transduction histidine kinase
VSGGRLEHFPWGTGRATRLEDGAGGAPVARLQAAIAALSGARTPDEVAEVALGAGLAALGGVHAFVLVERERGELRLLRALGAPEAHVRLAAGCEVPTPALECFRTAAPVFVEDREALAARYPQLAELGAGERGEAFAALPLALEGRPLGVLSVGYDGPRRFEEEERAVALALANQCAQALERARLLEAERAARAEAAAARRRLEFLDGVSALIAESGAEAELLTGVARLAVPALGEWAGLFVASDVGRLELAAAAGDAALGEVVLAHLHADPRGRLGRTGLCGEPLVVDDFSAHPGGAAQVAVLAPLCQKRRSIGALVVASGDGRARLGDADLSLVMDVAHRTALAVEHLRLLHEATAAAAAREEFLHVASHELRGPLGTLRLTVQLLGREVHKGDHAGLEERLRVLDRQAQRLVRLSDALLDVSRITAGRVELAREDGDLAALVHEVASAFAEEAAECECPLRVEAERPVPCRFDGGRIEQVVSNLISNALKYGRGRPIRISAGLEGGWAHIEVEDRGIGIAPEDQARIFERFERAVSGRHYAGLGLGLWIVQRLVQAHGGNVRVRSAPGKGATFTVELPAGG